MSSKNQQKSRPSHTVRSPLRVGLSLIIAMICLTDRVYATWVTTCTGGYYLILNTDRLDLLQGVCGTCPRGKKHAHYFKPETGHLDPTIYSSHLMCSDQDTLQF